MKGKKRVTLGLTEVNGNAFSIIAAFNKQAKREGWSKQDIEEVNTEAMSGDYDHLLSVIVDRVE